MSKNADTLIRLLEMAWRRDDIVLGVSCIPSNGSHGEAGEGARTIYRWSYVSMHSVLRTPRCWLC